MNCHSIVVVFENLYTGHISVLSKLFCLLLDTILQVYYTKFQITPSGPLRGGCCKWGNLPGPPDQGGGGKRCNFKKLFGEFFIYVSNGMREIF